MPKRGGQDSFIQIKNMLRPFFNNRRSIPRAKPFQTIRQIAHVSDLPRIYSIVEDNKAYKFPGLGNTFPATGVSIPDSTLRSLQPLSFVREARLHAIRANHHSNKISSALDHLSDIHNMISEGSWIEAEQSIHAFQKAYGLSVTSAKKDMLIAFQRHGLIGLSRRYNSLTEDSDRRAWGLICNVIYSMVDPATPPGRTLKTWLTSISKQSDSNSWYAAVLYWNMLQFSSSEQALAEIALRFPATSIIDLVLCLWSMSSVHPDAAGSIAFKNALNDEISSKLERNFTKGLIPSLPRYQSGSDQTADVDIYRFGFFFSEYSNIARWRAEISDVLFADGIPLEARLARSGDLICAAKKIASGEDRQEGSTDSRIREWLELAVQPGLNVGDISFVKGIVVAEAIRSISEDSPLVPEDLIALIGLVPTVYESMDGASLNAFAESVVVNKSPTLGFLARDLIFKRNRTADNDLERRAAFMMMFIKDGRSSIVPFLEDLNNWCEPASLYVARVLSRVFLEKLYLLMSSVKDVIETRIDICRWIISKDSADEVVAEELSALERELTNLDARSDIDSTRVHVDEEALREWYSDTQYSSATRYSRTVLSEGRDHPQDSFLSLYNRMKEGTDAVDSDDQEESTEDFILETRVGSQFVLLDVIEKTLKTFVSDRSFGLDSYLSRRIRHGTLSGFLVTPVSRVVQKVSEAEQASAPTNPDLGVVKQMLEGWRSFLTAELDRARRELIQIRSAEHPEGLIDPTWRVASGVTYLDAMIARVRPRVLESGGAYDVFPDIHSLCWDLLEIDLARVRRFINREFYRSVSEELSARFEDLSFEQRVIAYPYVSEIQTSFLSRTQEVCGWFIRPVFRRDKYNLATLANSMVSITRELDANYDFKDEVEIDPTLEINRGSFEVTSDVLFVLIGNAAKHGKRGGLISISGQKNLDGSPSLILSVLSQTETQELTRRPSPASCVHLAGKRQTLHTRLLRKGSREYGSSSGS